MWIPAPGGGFTPLDIAGLQLWLSDTGADPSVWPDLSGNGNDATQATSGSRPSIHAGVLNGHQVRRFDGVDDVLRLASLIPIGAPSNFTALIVQRQAAVNSILYPICQWSGGTPYVAVYFSDGNIYISNAVDYRYAADASTDFHVWTGRSSNDALELVKDGAPFATTDGATGFGGVGFDSIGSRASYAGDGDIAEILVYDSALSDPDRAAVEAYLASKYAL